MTFNVQDLLTKLYPIANSIPSMGGTEIGSTIQELASKVPIDGSIVEVGVWLGAGTSQIAMGVLRGSRKAQIHCYDLFKCFESQIDKAKIYGVNLSRSQDLLPLVQSYLESFPVRIVYHKGDIREMAYSGPSIYLYIDDASKDKEKFTHVISELEPYFVAGETFIILMDYFYYEKKPSKRLMFQKEYMTGNCKYSFIERISQEHSCALFQFVG